MNIRAVPILLGIIAATTAFADHDASGLDSVTTDVASIDSSLPMRVVPFAVDNASLGKAKHQDTALLVRDSAANMILVDVIEELRDAGFADVAELTGDQSTTAEGYVLSGSFTEFNPGSQSARVLWGFGAGKSKVCVRGSVSQAGKEIATFSTCQKSLGWGDSQQQMEAEVDRLGVSIGRFLIGWAKHQS